MGINISELKLDKNIPVPLYYQLKQLIREQINTEKLRVDDYIPTEIELSKLLDISRSTVRQALNELVAEGFLCRKKGKGTYVSKPKIDEGFFQILESFSQEMARKGLTPSTRVIRLQKVPGIENINIQLNIPLSEPLLYLSRIRYANEEPLVYLDTYLAYEQFPGLLEADLENHSLYTVLEQQYQKRVVRAVRKIEAVNAGAHEANLLDIKKHEAICLVKSIAYLEDGSPVEYSIARYRGDRNQFTVELVRK